MFRLSTVVVAVSAVVAVRTFVVPPSIAVPALSPTMSKSVAVNAPTTPPVVFCEASAE